MIEPKPGLSIGDEAEAVKEIGDQMAWSGRSMD
jgi:hypothetical protein